MPNTTYEWILSHVRRNIRPCSIDREQLAMDLWLESYPEKPTLIHIHHRCVDELRRLRRELTRNEAYASRPHYKSFDESLLERILQRAGLDEMEKKVLLLRFYLGRNNDEIAQELQLSERKVGEVFFVVMEKLKEEGRKEKRDG